jgi:hypothetical protein
MKGTFRMEYDQRVIMQILLNEGAAVYNIADRLWAQFGEHGYKLRMV